jgi:hypothetical protein
MFDDFFFQKHTLRSHDQSRLMIQHFALAGNLSCYVETRAGEMELQLIIRSASDGKVSS